MAITTLEEEDKSSQKRTLKNFRVLFYKCITQKYIEIKKA